jgi:hypothetical protein
VFGHVIYELAEQLSEKASHQCTRHIKSLLTVVITIIFSGSSKVSLQKSVDHVPYKVSLLQSTVLLLTHMGQEIISQQQEGVPDTSFKIVL